MSSSPSSRPRTAGSQTARCHSCGSRLRPEETWCSLCHQKVPTDTSDPTDISDPADTSAPAKPEPEPSLAAPVGRLSAKQADAEADRLITALAAAEADRARESRFGALQDRFGTGRSGLVLAVIGGVLMLGVGLVGLTVLGLLL
jgi:hypothetical protein